jgi:hypothetical protein
VVEDAEFVIGGGGGESWCEVRGQDSRRGYKSAEEAVVYRNVTSESFMPSPAEVDQSNAIAVR